METKSLRAFRLVTEAQESEVPYCSNLTNISEVEKFLRLIWPQDMDFRESFVVVFLNHSNVVLGYSVMFTGGASAVTVDVSMIFAAAINIPGCTGIILAHNHPSGSIKPSTADDKLTLKVAVAAKMMNIRLLDHLILCPNGNSYCYTDMGEMSKIERRICDLDLFN